jgi:hypothetical protein
MICHGERSMSHLSLQVKGAASHCELRHLNYVKVHPPTESEVQ